MYHKTVFINDFLMDFVTEPFFSSFSHRYLFLRTNNSVRFTPTSLFRKFHSFENWRYIQNITINSYVIINRIVFWQSENKISFRVFLFHVENYSYVGLKTTRYIKYYHANSLNIFPYVKLKFLFLSNLNPCILIPL
jgi:hypothetical protein